MEAPVFPVSLVFWKAPNNFGFNMQPLSSVSCIVLVDESSRARQSRTLKINVHILHQTSRSINPPVAFYDYLVNRLILAADEPEDRKRDLPPQKRPESWSPRS